MKRCRTCEIVSEICGKRLLYRIFYKNKRVTKDEILSHMKGLNLELVGGLHNRGWTVHDIDVVGGVRDVSILARRLQSDGISNPVHFCSPKGKHSHLTCLWKGLTLILKGG